MTLTPIDTTSEVAVSSYLEKARDWLATAVEMTGPEQIAAAKAEIATAAEATKQLGLSKEIQLDAQEMVRRAEYALGKAIRKGQAEGTIATQGKAPDFSQGEVKRVTDFGSTGELYARDGKPGVLTVADETPDPADFDAALAEAKAEGNLSRANVARKAREASGKPPRDDVARTADAETLNALMAFVRRAITPDVSERLAPKAKRRLITTFQHAIDVLTEQENQS